MGTKHGPTSGASWSSTKNNEARKKRQDQRPAALNTVASPNRDPSLSHHRCVNCFSDFCGYSSILRIFLSSSLLNSFPYSKIEKRATSAAIWIAVLISSSEAPAFLAK